MSDIKPTVATAYLLAEGDAVFLDAEGGWVSDLAKAFVADTPEKLEKLRDEMKESDRLAIIVDGYEMQVAREGDKIYPVKMREQYRILREPTVDYLADSLAARPDTVQQKMVA